MVQPGIPLNRPPTSLRVLFIDDASGGGAAIVRRLALDTATPGDALPLAITRVGRSEWAAGVDPARFDAVVLELGSVEGERWSDLDRVCARFEHPVVVLTAASDRGAGLEAVRRGAHDALDAARLAAGELARVLHYAVERERRTARPDARPTSDGADDARPTSDGADEIERRSQRLDSLEVLASGAAGSLHDVLKAVIGGVDAARRHAQADRPLCGRLDLIALAAERGIRLASQLQAFSGQSTPERRVIDLDPLLADAEPLLRAALAPRARLHVEVATHRTGVEVDPAQLYELLVHLVLGAAEAGGPGSTVRVRSSRLAIDPARAAHVEWSEDAQVGEYAVLDVSDDSSCGSLADLEPGATAIDAVRRLVLTHGGGFEAVAAPGRARCMRVMLPAAKDGLAAPPRRVTPREPDPVARPAPRVEREPVSRTRRATDPGRRATDGGRRATDLGRRAAELSGRATDMRARAPDADRATDVGRRA